jgi:hypothetical protein
MHDSTTVQEMPVVTIQTISVGQTVAETPPVTAPPVAPPIAAPPVAESAAAEWKCASCLETFADSIAAPTDKLDPITSSKFCGDCLVTFWHTPPNHTSRYVLRHPVTRTRLSDQQYRTFLQSQIGTEMAVFYPPYESLCQTKFGAGDVHYYRQQRPDMTPNIPVFEPRWSSV